MAVWPAVLPDILLIQGYREQFPDPVIRTQMDAGPVKARRRYTAGFRPIQGKIYCNANQVATLESFHQTVCQGGALSFDWINARTKSSVTYQWRGAPTIEAEHKDGFWVTLDLVQVA